MANSDEKQEIIQVSNIVIDGILYEQTYNPEQRKVKYVFLEESSGTIGTKSQVEHNKVIYKPILNADVTEKAIILPTEPMDYKSNKELMRDIKNHIHKYVDIPEVYEDVCTWYTMMTWLSDRMPSIPYLRFLGDYQTGKSRASGVVTGLCYHPFQFVTPSGASLYRTIERWKATLKLDESDFKYSDKTADIIKILNAGYEQGNRVPRCSGDNYDNIRYFDVYGPKIIANKTIFKDPSLENRCITILMKQTIRVNIPRNLTDEFHKEQQILRNKLLMWRLKNYSKVDISQARKLNLNDVDIRLQQITEGMVSLFVDMPEVLEKMRKVFVMHHNKMVEAREDTLDGRIVKTLLELKNGDMEYITASDIADKIQENYDGYYSIKPSVVGIHMKKLGIETSSPRKVDGVSKRCVIWNEQLMQQLKKKFVRTKTTDTTDTTVFQGDTTAPLDSYIQ